jgi:hypothetical protein
MSTGTVEVLRQARALIADPAHWTRGAHARNALDAITGVASSDACRWKDIVDVNDEDGHAAVLEMYDRAIALAESEPES